MRLSEGRERGFWARGSSWVAHAGALGVLDAEGSQWEDRFSDLWQRALDLSGRSPVGRRQDVHPLRFFGGFSFADEYPVPGIWDGYSSYHFILPAIEMSGGQGGCILKGRTWVAPGEDCAAAQTRVQRDLDELSETLRDTDEASRPEVRTRAEVRETGRDEWDAAVEEILDAVRGGDVSKVVLARVLDVLLEEGLDPVDVALRLWRGNPGTHAFLFEPEPESSLVGAAPETIVTLHQGVFHATAVAGSIARGSSDEEQAQLAKRLLESKKDLAEHAFAVRDMVRRLGTIATRVTAESSPHVLTLAGIQHLETEIRAWLPEPHTAVSVLGALHPTPAVCGLPRDDALALLHKKERFQRGWYAGPVGWFDTAGNGVFAPALRCALGRGPKWRLFAGAGIVDGSEPGAEWEETGIKFQPVLRALEEAGASFTALD